MDSEQENPGPFGGQFITALEDAGIIPRYTQKVIIEAGLDTFVTVHATLVHQDGEKVLLVVPVAVQGAKVEVVNDDAG